METPLRGLTLAGDWVKLAHPAMLMEAACLAGLRAANAILREHGLREEAIFAVPSKGVLAGLPERARSSDGGEHACRELVAPQTRVERWAGHAAPPTAQPGAGAPPKASAGEGPPEAPPPAATPPPAAPEEPDTVLLNGGCARCTGS